MNKKSFLNKLKKSLSVLNENERQDIISEYSDTINEKVKNGMTEEEAVKDFGNIDDLVKEILKAYKIDPDYKEKEDIPTESDIKKAARFLADKIRNVVSNFKRANGNITLELIIEIIIKIFLTLIIILILSGVMDLFNQIGESIFNDTPVTRVLNIFWNICLFVLFIILSLMIIVAMFKKYFEVDESVKEPIKKSKQIKNDIKETAKEVKPQKKVNNGPTLGYICLLIIKILIILWVIIPIMFIDLLAIIGLVLSCVYMFKGVDLLGLVFAFVGIVGLITYIIVLMFNLLFGKSKISVVPPLVNIGLLIIGGVLFANSLMEYEYIDKAPKVGEIKTTSEVIDVTKPINLSYSAYSSDDIKKVSDNNLKDGEAILEMTYNSIYDDVNISVENNYEDCENADYDCTPSDKNYVFVHFDEDTSGLKQFQELHNTLIENLKAKKIYNYEKLFDVSLTVKANDKTLEKIELD